jgi:DNA-directed RNA polymerase subunit M/transcription elongation factor TFIIS
MSERFRDLIPNDLLAFPYKKSQLMFSRSYLMAKEIAAREIGSERKMIKRIDVKCPHCEHGFDTTISLNDIRTDELIAEGKTLLSCPRCGRDHALYWELKFEKTIYKINR